MKTLFRLIVFVLLVGGWGLAASALHVVRTTGTGSREFIVVPKNRIGFADTYVDARAWTLDDVSNHPGVVRRLIETEKYIAIASATGETEPAEVQQKLTDAVLRGPQPPKVQATTEPAKKKPEPAPEAKAGKRKVDKKRKAEVALR